MEEENSDNEETSYKTRYARRVYVNLALEEGK